ncbi:hypothetical protein RDI58_029276 [Solanum bulbocastanum]|uniref:Uncharacterized protein n=1 Tax=Solanum bulbocastanum TaxID=147425 RepID=A0AAN8SU17_SOLBU
MVADMRSRMSLFVFGRSRLSNKKGKAAMFLGGMGIVRLIIHGQQHISSGPTLSSASGHAPCNNIDHRN